VHFGNGFDDGFNHYQIARLSRSVRMPSDTAQDLSVRMPSSLRASVTSRAQRQRVWDIAKLPLTPVCSGLRTTTLQQVCVRTTNFLSRPDDCWIKRLGRLFVHRRRRIFSPSPFRVAIIAKSCCCEQRDEVFCIAPSITANLHPESAKSILRMPAGSTRSLAKLPLPAR
jgi:hypothetical protein